MKILLCLLALFVCLVADAATNKVIQISLPANLSYRAKMNSAAGDTNIHRIDLMAIWQIKNTDGSVFHNAAVIKNYPFRRSEWNTLGNARTGYAQFPKKPITGNVEELSNAMEYSALGQPTTRRVTYRWID